MPSMATLHISKPAASPVAFVPPSAAAAVTSSNSVMEQQRQQQLGKPIAPPPPPIASVVSTHPTANFESNVVLLPQQYFYPCFFFYVITLLELLQDNEKLEAFFSTIPMSFLNPPRAGKKLLVLDLDHTLLDFTRKEVQSRFHTPMCDVVLFVMYFV